MNREINSPITRRGSLLWRLHSAQRKSRRRWQALGKWVCQRSPDLCLRLECVRKAVFRYDPEVTEITEVQVVALALCAAARLGFRALGGAGHTFEDALLTNLLPFWAWALLFGSVASGHLVALIRGRLGWRAIIAMLGFLTWSFVSVLMLLDGLTSPGTVLFPVVALCEAWVYLRLTTCSFESNSTNGATGEMSGAGSVSEMDNASDGSP